MLMQGRGIKSNREGFLEKIMLKFIFHLFIQNNSNRKSTEKTNLVLEILESISWQMYRVS